MWTFREEKVWVQFMSGRQEMEAKTTTIATVTATQTAFTQYLSAAPLKMVNI